MKRRVFILIYFVLSSLPALQSQNAPVTTAGRITNAVPGDPSIPVAVTITGFTNIGQFILTMNFDTTRVRYVSATTNSSLAGMTLTYTPPSGNTLGKLVFSWTGASNVSLSDGSSLADLVFSYVTGTGILSWAYTFTSICQYKQYVGGILTPLSDTPKYLFYLNGGISNRVAPVTFAPEITDPVPGSLPVDIIVNGFTDIGSLTLNLDYDPAIINYQNSFTKNPAFGGSFLVGDNPGSESNRRITVSWYGTPAVTLADGSILCTLNFTYPVARCNVCALSWYDIGPSCEYADGSGDVLIDMPQVDYYINGLVNAGLPVTWTGNISSAWNNAGNWDTCGTPGLTRNVIIPDVSPNSFPVLNIPGYCKTIRIETDATFSVSPTGSITVGNN